MRRKSGCYRPPGFHYGGPKGVIPDLDALNGNGQGEISHGPNIGRWTADIYLLMALRRPDVWPVGDLALAIAVQSVKRLG